MTWLWTLLIRSVAVAAAPVTLAPLGEHYPVLVLEKNENRQNLLVAYVHLDRQCRFRTDPQSPKQPLFDYYWLMDGSRYKPVHFLIKAGVRHRLRFKSWPQGGHSFTMRFTDLHELLHDLSDTEFKVQARNDGESCAVTATIRLGPSDGQRILHVQRIYSESAKTLIPPFRKVREITLKGVLEDTGTVFTRTYKAR